MPPIRMLEGNRRGVEERLTCPVEIDFWCDGSWHRGRVEDLCSGGVFISTGHAWAEKSSIRFRFRLPDHPGGKPIEGQGTVVWTDRIGFGLRFDDLKPESRARIKLFVDSELFDRGEPAAMGF